MELFIILAHQPDDLPVRFAEDNALSLRQRLGQRFLPFVNIRQLTV